MSGDRVVTDDQLNAFVDNQLNSTEHGELADVMRDDNAMARDVSEIRRVKRLVTDTYFALPDPPEIPRIRTHGWLQPTLRAAAAVLLLAIGTLTGITITQHEPTRAVPDIVTIKEFDPATARAEKILVHLSTYDGARVTAALDAAERLLKLRAAEGKPVELEIVANGNGLRILRDDSIYQKRIEALAARYANVSFRACGLAMAYFRLQENRDVVLLPEAEPIPNGALDEILKRIKGGWLYVRG